MAHAHIDGFERLVKILRLELKVSIGKIEIRSRRVAAPPDLNAFIQLVTKAIEAVRPVHEAHDLLNHMPVISTAKFIGCSENELLVCRVNTEETEAAWSVQARALQIEQSERTTTQHQCRFGAIEDDR